MGKDKVIVTSNYAERCMPYKVRMKCGHIETRMMRPATADIAWSETAEVEAPYAKCKACVEPPRADVTLSSGRVIAHTRQGNGSQVATPTTGDAAMTPEEWAEYCKIVGFAKQGPHGQPSTPWAQVTNAKKPGGWIEE